MPDAEIIFDVLAIVVFGWRGKSRGITSQVLGENKPESEQIPDITSLRYLSIYQLYQL